MNFRGMADLREDTRSLAHDFPKNIDVIVAIPRSGLLVSSILCLHLDLPVTDLNRLCQREFIDTGNRYEGSASFDEIDTALVLDDSVCSGAQMTETQQRLAEKDFPFDIEYGAIYVKPASRSYVDHWGEIVPGPRVFEWNIMHHGKLENCCVDIDGVLCRDPTPEENDDGENYSQFIRNVDPKRIPNKRISWLVTCRLEKYREETEQWLAEHGVEYDTLVMMDYPDMEARREAGDHAAYKANVYTETGASLVIESSPHQALEILDRTNKPVYCYETNEMLQPGRVNRASYKSRKFLTQFREDPPEALQSASQYLLRRCYSRISRTVS